MEFICRFPSGDVCIEAEDSKEASFKAVEISKERGEQLIDFGYKSTMTPEPLELTGDCLKKKELNSSKEFQYYVGPLSPVLGDLWEELCNTGVAQQTGFFKLKGYEFFIFNTGADGEYKVWSYFDCGLENGEPKYPGLEIESIDLLTTDTAELGVLPVELLQVSIEEAETIGWIEEIDDVDYAAIDYAESKLMSIEGAIIFTDFAINQRKE